MQYAIEHQLSDDYILLSILPWLYGRCFLNDKDRLKKLKARLMDNPYPQTLAGFLTQSHVVLDFDISARLPEIKTECLIVASDEDLFIPRHCLVTQGQVLNPLFTILKHSEKYRIYLKN